MPTPITPRTRGLLLLGVALLAGGFVPVGASADNPNSVPSVIVPVDPARILDTRSGLGVGTAGAMTAGQTISLQVAGAGGVPAQATGVVLNVTVTGATGAGYVSAYPTGGTQPNASVINYSPGIDVANMITATLGTGGGIDLFNAQSSAHLVADVAGYLVPGGGGTVGPAGPSGPQGPVGPSAPAGIGFNQNLGVPAAGASDLVVLAPIDTVTVKLRCTAGGVASIRFENGASGTMRLAGMQYNHPDQPTTFHDLGAAQGGVVAAQTLSQSYLSATVITATGEFARVEATITSNGGTCTYRGTIVPV